MSFDKRIYDTEYAKQNTERVELKIHNRYRLSERIQTQVIKGNAKSRQDYILQAVLKRLEEDEKQ